MNVNVTNVYEYAVGLAYRASESEKLNKYKKNNRGKDLTLIHLFSSLSNNNQSIFFAL